MTATITAGIAGFVLGLIIVAVIMLWDLYHNPPMR